MVALEIAHKPENILIGLEKNSLSEVSWVAP